MQLLVTSALLGSLVFRAGVSALTLHVVGTQTSTLIVTLAPAHLSAPAPPVTVLRMGTLASPLPVALMGTVTPSLPVTLVTSLLAVMARSRRGLWALAEPVVLLGGTLARSVGAPRMGTLTPVALSAVGCLAPVFPPVLWAVAPVAMGALAPFVSMLLRWTLAVPVATRFLRAQTLLSSVLSTWAVALSVGSGLVVTSTSSSPRTLGTVAEPVASPSLWTVTLLSALMLTFTPSPALTSSLTVGLTPLASTSSYLAPARSLGALTEPVTPFPVWTLALFAV